MFDNISHLVKHIKSTPLNFLPDRVVHLKCKNSESVIFSPFHVKTEIKDGQCIVTGITNLVKNACEDCGGSIPHDN